LQNTQSAENGNIAISLGPVPSRRLGQSLGINNIPQKICSYAYVADPTRPPAGQWVLPTDEHIINLAYQIFSDVLGADRVEYLVGFQGNAFASTGDAKDDLLSITAIHPNAQGCRGRIADEERSNMEHGHSTRIGRTTRVTGI